MTVGVGVRGVRYPYCTNKGVIIQYQNMLIFLAAFFLYGINACLCLAAYICVYICVFCTTSTPRNQYCRHAHAQSYSVARFERSAEIGRTAVRTATSSV